MPRFAANLSMLFPELPFLDRFDAAREAGFEAVEFQFPYAFALRDIQERVKRNALTVLLHNVPSGDWAAGERGIACMPSRVAEFRDGVARAMEYAQGLGVKRINVLSGIAPASEDPQRVWATLVENLRYAAETMQPLGIQTMVEACNRYDIPGFLINTSAAAMRAIEAANHPNLRFQYDVYHMQRSEGELLATLERLLPHIGHIQIADNPGRHQPGTGEINYPFLFAALDRMGYEGWVAGEYHPAGKTTASLGWAGL